MGRKSNVIDMLVERKLIENDANLRNAGVKARLDKIGSLLNGVKHVWNTANKNNAGLTIDEPDYDAKEFE